MSGWSSEPAASTASTVVGAVLALGVLTPAAATRWLAQRYRARWEPSPPAPPPGGPFRARPSARHAAPRAPRATLLAAWVCATLAQLAVPSAAIAVVIPWLYLSNDGGLDAASTPMAIAHAGSLLGLVSTVHCGRAALFLLRAELLEATERARRLLGWASGFALMALVVGGAAVAAWALLGPTATGLSDDALLLWILRSEAIGLAVVAAAHAIPLAAIAVGVRAGSRALGAPSAAPAHARSP